MKTLEELIPEIEKIHELRLNALDLRRAAVQALVGGPYRPGRRGWADPGDRVELALVVRALQQDRQHASTDRQALLADTCALLTNPSVVIDGPLPASGAEVGQPGDDGIPIFRCAVALQVFAEVPELALSGPALRCLARIANELYDVDAPAWAAGAARAGERALPTAFVTGECARALLAMEAALIRTAQVAQMLGQAADRAARTRVGLQQWIRRESAFRNESLRVSLAELVPHTVVPVTELPPKREPAEGLTDLIARLNSAADQASTAFEVPPRICGKGRDVVKCLIRAIVSGAAGPKTGVELSRKLRLAAQGLRNLLAPIEHFASVVIDRELAADSPHLGRPVDAAELVFAAALFGRIAESGWQHPKTIAALQLIKRLLSADGRLLRLRPFDVGEKGYQLYVHPLEVTRRLAELVANVDEDPELRFVQKLLRPFADARARSADGFEAGWVADPLGQTLVSEWGTTALALDALNRIVEMLDAVINRQVLGNFSVRAPAELRLDLDSLFYPDFGLPDKDHSVAIKLQHLRQHASRGAEYQTESFSLILYGPPGTGKTTLVEALAKSASVPLIEVTPSDILIAGEEHIERRARLVFSALSMLTHAVILFDEFDSILQERSSATAPAINIFQFLTPGMLPKLKRLHDAAERQRVSYVLATNFVYRLDKAATREGRFDDRHGIYPPDLVSRLGRLLDEYYRFEGAPPDVIRTLEVVRQTSCSPMVRIAAPGWFTAPRAESTLEPGTIFYYLKTGNGGSPTIPSEASFDRDWRANTETEPNQPDAQKYWEQWERMDQAEQSAKTNSPTGSWEEFVEACTRR